MAAEAGFLPEPPLLNPRTRFATSNFAVKAIFLVFSVVLLSLYPSRAPDIIGGSFLNQGWELLHLLLVGIAVSYGLFSRRYADPDAEKAAGGSSTAAAVVNKAEASLSYLSRMNLRVATVFDEDEEEMVERESVLNETRVWNSRYSRGEPALVVEEKRDVKPLCLPVRSLRPQQVHKPAPANPARRDEALDGFTSASGGGPHPRSGSAGWVNKTEKSGGGLSNVYSGPGREEETSTDVVLPSPIPWRSRSGRLEPKVKAGTATPPPSPRPPNPGSLRPPNTGSPPLPPNVDPGVSRTPSFRSTTARKPPPPPPPPPPHFPSPSLSAEVGTKVVEDVPKRRSVRTRTPPVPPPPPPPPPPPSAASSRSHKHQSGLRRSFTDELKDMSTSGGRQRAWPAAPIPEDTRQQHLLRPRAEQEPEPPGQKSSPKSRKTRKKNKKPPRRFIMESDDSDDSSESSTTDNAEDNGGASSSATDDAEPDANEVDKKADEFIAKFREQIRLQRIESIKKSAQQRQRAGKSTT